MNHKSVQIIFMFFLLFLFAGCLPQTRKKRQEQQDKVLNFSSLVETWNNKCPISLIDDEIDLTEIYYSDNKYSIVITLGEEAPTSVKSLDSLLSYLNYIVENDFYFDTSYERGVQPFVKGLITQSSILKQLVDTIAVLTDTPETTHGYLPLVFIIKDAMDNDSTSLRYNCEWLELTEYEWLNAILPLDMLKTFGRLSDGSISMLNQEVSFDAVPKVTKDGYLRISCYFDSDPLSRESGKELQIAEVLDKYFTKDILSKFLITQAEKSKSIYCYLRACRRRGIDAKFVIEGSTYGSVGGCDSIVISLKNI